MPNKGLHIGVCLSEEGQREVRWQLDIRAWTVLDWTAAAGVNHQTAYRWVKGRHIHPLNAAKLQQAFLENAPIEGLANLLQTEAAS